MNIQLNQIMKNSSNHDHLQKIGLIRLEFKFLMNNYAFSEHQEQISFIFKEKYQY